MCGARTQLDFLCVSVVAMAWFHASLEIATPQLSWQVEIIVREGGKKMHLMHYAPGLYHSGD